MVLKPGHDWFYPYYRDRALCLTLGMTPLEMLLGAVGAKDDPNSGGRQMPSHWGHKALNIVSQSSPTGTQCLHAIGSRRSRAALRDGSPSIEGRESRFKNDEVTYVSIGDGTTSEGEFWESLNSACTLKLPVVYLIEDNGYAISVPVEVQTPGGDISKLVASFPGLFVQSIDGTDFLDSYKAMTRGRGLRARAQGPGVRPRQGHPPVLALAVGRREAVQDGGRARRGGEARSDYAGSRRSSSQRGHRERSRS